MPQDDHTPPISPVLLVRPAPSVPTRQVFCHRGFSLAIRRSDASAGGTQAGGRPAGYAFTIAQNGYTLHTSRADFATAGSADRAARCFVDDALGAFDVATQALEA